MSLPRPVARPAAAAHAVAVAAAVAVGLAALAGGASAPRVARAATGDDAAVLRDAFGVLVDGLPEPVTKADKKLRAKLTKAVSILTDPPASLVEEVRAAVAAIKLLPRSILKDPAFDLASDATRAGLGAQVSATLTAIEDGLAKYGDPAPAGIAAVRARIAQCRAKVGMATNAATADKAAWSALGAAAQKLVATYDRLDAFEATLATCGPVTYEDLVRTGSATVTFGVGAPVELPLLGGIAEGQSEATSFNASAYVIPQELEILVRWPAVRAGETIPVTNQVGFERGIAVHFNDGSRQFVCDTGSFRVSFARVRRYVPTSPEPYTKYLEVRGTLTASGPGASGATTDRVSVTAELHFCEIPFDTVTPSGD